MDATNLNNHDDDDDDDDDEDDDSDDFDEKMDPYTFSEEEEASSPVLPGKILRTVH